MKLQPRRREHGQFRRIEHRLAVFVLTDDVAGAGAQETSMTLNIISGNDSANTLAGSAGDDLIYGFNPNAAYASADNCCDARRVGAGPAALCDGAARRYRQAVHCREDRGDQGSRSRHRIGAWHAVPDRLGQYRERARPARHGLRSGLREQRLFLHLSHDANRE